MEFKGPERNQVLQAAYDYISRGFKVIPLDGKMPIWGKGWQHRAAPDEEVATSLWDVKEVPNIGVQLGPESGIIDIEFDTSQGEETFKEVVGECYTPTYRSKRSTHKIFQYSDRLPPVGMRMCRGLEIRIGYNGAQSVFPPSMHESGVMYQWVEGLSLDDVDPLPVPQAIFDLIESEGNSGQHGETQVSEQGLVIVPGTRHHFAKDYAVHLSREGWSRDQIATILMAMFSTQPEPADPDGIRSLAKWAKENIPYQPPVDFSAMENQEERRRSGYAFPPNPGTFPTDLLDVPGFVGHVAAWTNATAHYKQPVLALAGALALMSTLCARKVISDNGNYTGLYYMGTAPSTYGKEAARETNRRILEECGGMELYAGEGIASSSGFLQGVADCPAGLWQIDEFGKFLVGVFGGKAESWKRDIPEYLKVIFSSQNSTFIGPAKADSSKTIRITNPCPSVYATGTPEPIYASMSDEQLEDGWLSRILWFEGSSKPRINKERPKGIPELSKEIRDVAEHWIHLRGEGNVRSISNPVLMEVPTTPEADALFDQFGEFCDDMRSTPEYRERSSPWGRAREKAIRLALVYACSKNHYSPEITLDAGEWGCAVSKYCTERLLYLASNHIAISKFDKQQKQVLEWLRKQEGKQATKSATSARFSGFNGRDRKEIIDNLVETGMIAITQSDGPGKKSVIYQVLD